MDIAKFLRAAFFTEHLRWLLLAVLPQCNEVSWGACSLISLLHVLSILIENLHKMLQNSSLMSRNNTIYSFLELIFHVLWISDYILVKYMLLSILMKNLHKGLHK